jgi:CheY-like chemotaxis protein
MNIYIATDNLSEAKIVKENLTKNLPEAIIQSLTKNALNDLHFDHASIFIFAFKSVQESMNFRLPLINKLDQLNQLGQISKNKPYRTILFCDQNEEATAEQLCTEQKFNHHLVCLPINADTSLMTTLVKRIGFELDNELRLKKLSSQQNERNVPTQNQKIDPKDLALTQFQFGLKDPRPIVLMIDDDPFQHDIVESILDNENYHLKFALNYYDALQIMGNSKPKLILMDVMMPEVDGIETTKRLKSNMKFSHIPILMVTGNSDREVVRKSIHAGAIDFLVKPFNKNTLINKLQTIINAPDK